MFSVVFYSQEHSESTSGSRWLTNFFSGFSCPRIHLWYNFHGNAISSFLCEVANRETDKCQVLHNLLGGGKKIVA